MSGGKREAGLTLCFSTNKPDYRGQFKWCTSGKFYEAKIQVDLIISYPWLQKKKLGVFPHLEGLVELEENEPITILRSLEPPFISTTITYDS